MNKGLKGEVSISGFLSLLVFFLSIHIGNDLKQVFKHHHHQKNINRGHGELLPTGTPILSTCMDDDYSSFSSSYFSSTSSGKRERERGNKHKISINCHYYLLLKMVERKSNFFISFSSLMIVIS